MLLASQTRQRKKEKMLEYLPDYLIPLMIKTIHLLISFNLKLPDNYKNKLKAYSVGVNFLCMLFIGFFALIYDSWPFTQQGIQTFRYSGYTMYFLPVIPLGVALGFHLYTSIMNLNIQSMLLKRLLVVVSLMLLVGIIVLGLYLLVFYFYFSGILLRLLEEIYIPQ